MNKTAVVAAFCSASVALDLAFVLYIAVINGPKHDYYNDVIFGCGVGVNIAAVFCFCAWKVMDCCCEGGPKQTPPERTNDE